MTLQEEIFLKRVKAILISIGVAKMDVVLDVKSWLAYLQDGYTPVQAVKEDFDCELPRFSWAKTSEILKQIK